MMENIENHREHTTVDIDKAWVTSMRQKLSATSSEPASKDQHSIYIVPQHIYETDEKAYEPKIISIGPYHHGKQCLRTMEEHKWRYLNAILSRNMDLSLENYLAEIKKMEVRARSCYSESINHFESNQFVQMMVLDGCFIVELFLNSEAKMAMKEEEIFLLKKEADEDPIYGTNWMLLLVAHDMLLLENQLPFFVLQFLFKLVDKSSTPSSLSQLALNFFHNFLPRKNGIDPTDEDRGKILHLLHLFHSGFLPVKKKALDFLSYYYYIRPAPPKLIPSATELKAAGVKFKQKKMDMGSFLEVDFRKGVMEIPHLSIYEFTNSMFRNFIAFEQCFPIYGAHFTRYTILMDCLINTANDVAILKQNKIVEHMMGSDEEVAILFNRLGKGVAVDFEDCYFYYLFNDVNQYCKTNWHIWRANLVHRYFRNPCTIMSLVAAILILTLTFTQTFFSVFSYARPP
ncbi:UPF0481 protein At3g47200-like [Tasmannia lanceolata]|uniref:UPF0481 protein At3g47200-like n=1 Tax=Tasmannia lanceolata TaxID=3420 RepID=UPI004062C761